MAEKANGEVLCPKCRIPTSYVSETEKSNGTARVVRYYKCPACWGKLLDEEVTVNRIGDRIEVRITYKKRFIPGVNGKTRNVQSKNKKILDRLNRIQKLVNNS